MHEGATNHKIIFVTWIRVALQLLFTVIIGASIWFGIVNRVENLERQHVEDRAIIDRMDREGTNASKYAIQEEKAALLRFEGRIAFIEEQSRKIDVMMEKISRIDDTQKEMKSNLAHHP